jgi:hypothetical protein
MVTHDHTRVGMSVEEKAEIDTALFHALIDTSAVLAGIGLLSNGRKLDPKVNVLRDQLNSVIGAITAAQTAFSAACERTGQRDV